MRKEIEREIVKLHKQGAKMGDIKASILRDYGERVFSDDIKALVGKGAPETDWTRLHEDALEVAESHRDLKSLSKELSMWPQYQKYSPRAIHMKLLGLSNLEGIQERLSIPGEKSFSLLHEHAMELAPSHSTLRSLAKTISMKWQYSGYSEGSIYQQLLRHESRHELEALLGGQAQAPREGASEAIFKLKKSLKRINPNFVSEIEALSNQDIFKAIHYIFPDTSKLREITRIDAHPDGPLGEGKGVDTADFIIHGALDSGHKEELLPMLARAYAKHAAEKPLEELFKGPGFREGSHKLFIPELDAESREATAIAIKGADIRPMRLLEIGPGLRGVQLLDNWKGLRRNGRLTMVEKDEFTSLFLREYAKERKISNVEIVNKDIFDYAPKERFDHIRADLVANILHQRGLASKFGEHVGKRLLRGGGMLEIGEASPNSLRKYEFHKKVREGMGPGFAVKTSGRKAYIHRK